MRLIQDALRVILLFAPLWKYVLGSNATPDAGHIMGGAGFGLIDASADGEVASPVNLGVAQRSDDLFQAMSDQVLDVQAQIVGSGVDIVGALSAMNVFDMGAPTDRDPTVSSFMSSVPAFGCRCSHL